MGDDLKWLIGIGVSLTGVWGALLAGAFWRLVAMVRRVDEKVDGKTDELHSRVNRIREDTVQKADLDGHLGRIENQMREMRQETRDASKQTNDRLDALLSAIASSNRNSGP